MDSKNPLGRGLCCDFPIFSAWLHMLSSPVPGFVGLCWLYKWRIAVIKSRCWKSVATYGRRLCPQEGLLTLPYPIGDLLPWTSLVSNKKRWISPFRCWGEWYTSKEEALRCCCPIAAVKESIYNRFPVRGLMLCYWMLLPNIHLFEFFSIMGCNLQMWQKLVRWGPMAKQASCLTTQEMF